MNKISYNNEAITPSKIVCIGRNYVEHIVELQNDIPTEPVIFIKPNSAISETLQSGKGEEVHYEGEICFLVKDGNIAGIGCGLDLTKRKVQSSLKSKGLPWERAKAFDGSAVFSDFVDCDGDLADYSMELYINDGLKQSASYDLMIYKPRDLIAEVQTFLTLEDGDILMTGTPKGVGILVSGDRFTMKLYKNRKTLISTSWVVK